MSNCTIHRLRRMLERAFVHGNHGLVDEDAVRDAIGEIERLSRDLEDSSAIAKGAIQAAMNNAKQIERLRGKAEKLDRLRSLCVELDEALDGVRLPKLVASVANGLRAMLENLERGGV